MMTDFIRWLIGYVSFKFFGGFCEGFINDCYAAGLNIQNIKIENGVLFAECTSGLYPRLRKIARKNGGRLKVLKKHGIIFILEKVKNRWGIFVGLVLGVMFLCFMSGFVWNVEVTGCERLSEGEIRTFLADNGLSEGSYWKSVDKGKIENLLLASFDDVAWAHINRDGTTARVEINEAVLKPKTVSRKKISNVKAKKNGVIVKITVYDGWQKINKGDAVQKGDLLISGVYSGEKGSVQFTHARGECLARVKEKFNLTINRNQSEKRYLSEKRQKTLLFFGLEIPLYIGKTPENSEIESESRYFRLNGKNLPLGVRISKVKTYREEVKTLSDSELTALMNREIERKLKEDFGNYKILKKKINTSLTDSSAEAQGCVICIEDIGKEEKIKIKKPSRP